MNTNLLDTFIQLFEATSRPEQAAEWRTKLSLVQAAGPRGRPAWPRFSINEENHNAAKNE